jgi:hypothetical protein
MSKNKKNKKSISTLEVVKASRRGSREAELENSTGFIAIHKTHRSKKSYFRKEKHKHSRIF